MKKTLPFLVAISLFLVSGCTKEYKETPNKNSSVNTGLSVEEENTGTKFSEEKKDINIHGDIASGIIISGNNISLSGELLNYNNIFSITLPKKGLSQRDFYNSYGDTLHITDGDLNSVQINTYTLSQNSKCDYNFEEGVLSISKSSKILDGKKLNLANAVFEITGPGIDKPMKSWQSFLCFSDGESVYKITVSDDSKYRTDIINSFSFFK